MALKLFSTGILLLAHHFDIAASDRDSLMAELEPYRTFVEQVRQKMRREEYDG